MSYGRRKIYTNEEVVTVENIRDVLRKAYFEHQMNRGNITKLWDYYRGKTEILYKTKEVCENTNHKYGRKRLLSCKPSIGCHFAFVKKGLTKWWGGGIINVLGVPRCRLRESL